MQPTVKLGRGRSLARSSSFPRAQWLGTVDANGMHGALMLGPTGRYFLVIGEAAHPLDTDAVLQAIEQAAADMVPQPRRPRGAPTLHGERMAQYSVNLTPTQEACASELGAGNLSAGIRRLIDAHRKAAHP